MQTLVGHSGTVRCLYLEGNRLVSGSTDCTIKVWDLSSQQSWTSIACKVTMVGHTDTVRCLQVIENAVNNYCTVVYFYKYCWQFECIAVLCM